MYEIFQRCFKRQAVRSDREASVLTDRLALEQLESREMLAAIAFEVSAAVDLQALTAWVESQNSVALVAVTCDHQQHSIEAGPGTVADANGTGEETASETSPDAIVFALEGNVSAVELAEILNAVGVEKWYAVDNCHSDFANSQIAAATAGVEMNDQQSKTTQATANANNEKSQPTALLETVGQKQDSSIRNAVAVADFTQSNVSIIPKATTQPQIGLQTISLTGPADELNLPARLVQAPEFDLARPRYFASSQPNENTRIENRLAAGMLDNHQAFTLIEPFQNSHSTIKRLDAKQNESIQDVSQAQNLQPEKPGLSELSSISTPFSPIFFAYHPAVFAEAVLEFVDASEQLPNNGRPIADEAVMKLTSVAAVENSNLKPNEGDHLLTSTISSLLICGMLTEPHILRRPTKTAPEVPSLHKD